MKKIMLMVVGLVFLLLSQSCSKEEVEVPIEKEKLDLLKEQATQIKIGGENVLSRVNPNNVLILYASNRKGMTNQTDNWEIWVMDLSEDEQNGTLQLTNNDAYDCYWPRVSPDKTKMLFYRTPKGFKESDYHKYALWSLDLTTFQETEIIPLSRYNWKKQGTVSWSPDGTKWVMFARKSNNKQSLFITDTNGNILQEINNGGGNYTDPSWSPDGQSLCFAKNGEIYTLDIAANQEKKITCDLFPDYDPFWSPDGTEIAFESYMLYPLENCLLGRWNLRSVKVNQVPNNGNCFQINAQTNTIRGAANSGHAVPRWTSDSEYLFFHYGSNCSVAHLALIKRDGSGFTEENVAGRNYGKTSPDIYEF